MLHTLFEVSWEVCNKVGGIHTVISTKAKTISRRYGDDYIAMGPWLLSNEASTLPFEDTPGYEDFSEACRDMGIPVRIGRWLIPGQPRTILVEFSGLFERKDEILAGLWESHKVDSLTGEWDYLEPVMFGHACGLVIEKWWQENLDPFRGKAVAHFHEWMTASGMLYLNSQAPSIGTVFTTHATMLGRAVSATGQSPEDGLMGRDPEDLAEGMGVTSKHSLEGIAARDSDVFTTVSEITADEAQTFHHRRADPILPNGIDLEVIDEIAGDTDRHEARRMLENVASRFLGEDVSGASMSAISGRYEFVNKGIDIFLDSAARMNERDGRKVICFVLVPAGNSGPKKELMERLESDSTEFEGSVGISTHNLFDEERDPVHEHCRKIGLTNEPGSRVKVIQIPIYMTPTDGFLNLPYEAVLRAMDLSCFPSFYEPWGYTPEESLAVGVPTVTSDYAGFGRWLRAAGLGPEDGVYVLSRIGVEQEDVVTGLQDILESFLGSDRDRDEIIDVCRRTAQRTAWSGLVKNYYQAYDQALEIAQRRTSEKSDGRAFRKRIANTDGPGLPTGGPRLSQFHVSARIPSELQGLERLAQNYWWSWDHEATALFEELSPVRWQACGHNPMLLLRDVFPEDLEAKANDGNYVTRLDRVLSRFDAYLDAAKDADGPAMTRQHPVAYFSAEFAIHESLKIYSGGLGVLAGDHLKSASDLNIPLVGVGLFYRRGYMKQRLTASGDQIADADTNQPDELAVEPVLDAQGDPLEIVIQLPSSRLSLRAWRVDVGRVPLYLLDSNVESNRDEDREITAQLYAGDQENRLRQEIVLGRGGTKLLRAIGVEPSVYHCNEGHAAFLSLERVRNLIREQSLTFEEAREVCCATTVFTTHTPVPAGHDRFGEDLMRRYFSDAPSWVGVPWERFWKLGQAEGDEGDFNMTYLAMNFANFTNGVSKLHGAVSQELLHPYWKNLLETEVPIESVTNGVHLPTWTSQPLAGLIAGKGKALTTADFADSESLDANELWDVRQTAKRTLIQHVESSLRDSFRSRNDSPGVLARMVDGLDERALYIGFARRFAPYKRAHLMFLEPDRLAKLLGDTDRPVRILIAGKAHPRDGRGQEILRGVAELARSERFLGKVLFLENYDVELARHLVQGVDVWLNTPTRPLEASGTSGMKVAANGGLNVSVPDGWWIEAEDGRNGWSIGGVRSYDDQRLQDELDATTLYRLFEDEIVPMFFDRENGLPDEWLNRVRHSLATIPAMFNTDRMVGEYREKAYETLAANHTSLASENFMLARSLAERHSRIRKAFSGLRVIDANVGQLAELKIGDPVDVSVTLDLGALHDGDVIVELVLGHTRTESELQNIVAVPLEPAQPLDETVRVFEGSYRMERCGNFACGVRVRARETSPLDFRLKEHVLWF